MSNQSDRVKCRAISIKEISDHEMIKIDLKVQGEKCNKFNTDIGIQGILWMNCNKQQLIDNFGIVQLQ